MIQPVNNHLLIEPVKHQTFLQGEKETFEEVGIVMEIDSDLENEVGLNKTKGIKIGDKVFFDSWLASKYPKNETEWYWLVSWQDVRAIEHHEENPISE